MGKYVIDYNTLTRIAEAIRQKTGNYSTKYDPSDMPNAISNIRPKLQRKRVYQNGIFYPDIGMDGFSSVEVYVSHSGGSGWLFQYEEITDTPRTDLPAPEKGKTYTFIADYMQDGVMDELDTATCDERGNLYFSAYNGEFILNFVHDMGWYFSPDSTTWDAIVSIRDDAAYAKENKLPQRIDCSLTDATKFDFEGITKISPYAFYDCNQMVSADIPNTITSIGRSAFYGCSSLKKVNIPEVIKTIEQGTFCSCSSIEEIEIPLGVTRIDELSFAFCSSLRKITMKSHTPPTIGSTTFSDLPSNCAIFVPSGCRSAYQNASNWSKWASQLVEDIDDEGVEYEYLFKNEYVSTENNTLPVPIISYSYTCFKNGIAIGSSYTTLDDGLINLVFVDEHGNQFGYYGNKWYNSTGSGYFSVRKDWQ